MNTLLGLVVFTQETAVVGMDHCSAHVSDDMISIFTSASVHVITFAPRTTKVFQVLDLTLCDVPKQCPGYELSFDDDNATEKTLVPFSV
jgi:hypothetical protein